LQPAPTVLTPPQPQQPAPVQAAIPLPVHAPPPPVVHAPVVQEQPVLSEVTPPQSVPSFMSRLGAMLTVSRNWLLLAAAAIVAAIVLFVLGSLLLRWKRRRMRQYVWVLPEPSSAPAIRLGGPHCGASGAFIRYG
jgi:protein-S-isoprenylcysteine O-methyltransferase Ste14